MDWQEWIVIIILVVCLYFIGRGIYNFFIRKSNDDDSPCSYCGEANCPFKQRFNDATVGSGYSHNDSKYEGKHFRQSHSPCNEKVGQGCCGSGHAYKEKARECRGKKKKGGCCCG